MLAMYAYMASPLLTTGDMYQIILNHRHKTFAGQYKLTLLIQLFEQLVLRPMLYIPRVVGDISLRNEYALVDLKDLAMTLAWALQAVIYPKVSQDVIVDKDI